MPHSSTCTVVSNAIFLVQKGGEMDRSGVVVPWEHWVCTRCLQDNPHAVWLIKLKCFQPRRRGHCYPEEKTLVSIEPSTMQLVRVRPLPKCAWTIRGKFMFCRNHPSCHNGDSCTYAHTYVEQHTWNFKKTLYKGSFPKCTVWYSTTITRTPLYLQNQT